MPNIEQANTAELIDKLEERIISMTGLFIGANFESNSLDELPELHQLLSENTEKTPRVAFLPGMYFLIKRYAHHINESIDIAEELNTADAQSSEKLTNLFEQLNTKLYRVTLQFNDYCKKKQDGQIPDNGFVLMALEAFFQVIKSIKIFIKELSPTHAVTIESMVYFPSDNTPTQTVGVGGRDRVFDDNQVPFLQKQKIAGVYDKLYSDNSGKIDENQGGQSYPSSPETYYKPKEWWKIDNLNPSTSSVSSGEIVVAVKDYNKVVPHQTKTLQNRLTLRSLKIFSTKNFEK